MRAADARRAARAPLPRAELRLFFSPLSYRFAAGAFAA
jgi:hypothetical protein